MPSSTPESLRRLGESLAHHLNNALTGVIGFLELALREAAPSSDQSRQLQAGLVCAARAAEAVRRIVQYACRPERPRTSETFDLRTLADALAAELNGRLGPSWKVRVEGAAKAVVRGSERAVRLALEQLVANAVEATPVGGEVLLDVTSADRGVLAVRDTGAGLTPEAAAHLFEPFVTSKPSPHLGVGLALARDLLLPDGGRIEVRSESGRGTTASLSLPLADLPQAPRPTSSDS